LSRILIRLGLSGDEPPAEQGFLQRKQDHNARKAYRQAVFEHPDLNLIAMQHGRGQTLGSPDGRFGAWAMAEVVPLNPSKASAAKDLYAIGEIPPLGVVPPKMHAWAIRKERHGPPVTSMQLEVLPTWPIGEDEVLVYVMAAGVNYNGVWAGLGIPISPFDGHKQPFHIAGSDAAGVVWAIGAKVRRWKVGDEVIVHCNQDDGDDEDCNGGDPLLSPSQRIWGYETPDGSFAQFCRVQSRQLMQKPAHLSWEESACYTLTLATAYRMLFGHPPHTLKPGDNVLIWGASGGLGVFGLQLVAASGANAIAVVSDESKMEYVFLGMHKLMPQSPEPPSLI